MKSPGHGVEGSGADEEFGKESERGVEDSVWSRLWNSVKGLDVE